MIAGCIMVKNEEKMILQCIRSLKAFCDEVIVVNDNSEDNTINIVANEGVRVVKANKKFDENRNLFFENTNQKWIFILDADEFITLEDGLKLRDTLQKVEENIDRISLKKIEYLGECKWAINDNLRVFRNKTGLRFFGEIHARNGNSVASKSKRMEMRNISIHHFACFNKTELKRNKYINLTLNELEKNPNDNFMQWVLGNEYIAINEYEKACLCFKNILQQKIPLEHKCSALIGIAWLEWKRGDYDKAEKIAQQILKEISINDRGYFCFLYAYAILLINRYQKKMFKDCIEILDIMATFCDDACIWLNYYMIYKKQGIIKVEYLETAIDKNPMLRNPLIYNLAINDNALLFKHYVMFVDDIFIGDLKEFLNR